MSGLRFVACGLNPVLEILAPAKLNLGLEVLRKRDDGFHDLKTIFCAVSLFDRIQIRVADQDRLRVSDPALQDGNLITRALQCWDESGLERPRLDITVHKRIPAAAGLGGASSDAASILRVLASGAGLDQHSSEVATLAAMLGSDVAFFLQGGRAVGEGRGEVLRRLPYRRLAALIVTPKLVMHDKTRSMFASLTPDDMSDGLAIQHVIDNPDLVFDRVGAPLPNTFERPLYAFYPELLSISAEIRSAVGLYPSLSGAGPSLYLLARTLREAHDMRRTIDSLRLALPSALHCVRAIAGSALTTHRDG